MITINYLMAQALLVLRAKLKKENTAGRIGGLFRDILLFIQNMILGIILKGSLANEAAIKAVVDPVRGDTYKAIDTGHYWCYDGARWNDIGEIIPSNVANLDDINEVAINVYNVITNSFSKYDVIADSNGWALQYETAIDFSVIETNNVYLRQNIIADSSGYVDSGFDWKNRLLEKLVIEEFTPSIYNIECDYQGNVLHFVKAWSTTDLGAPNKISGYFSKEMTVLEYPSHLAFPGLTSTKNGVLHAFFRVGRYHTGTDGHIMYSFSRDFGVSWSNPTVVLAGGDQVGEYFGDWRDSKAITMSNGKVLLSSTKNYGKVIDGVPPNNIEYNYEIMETYAVEFDLKADGTIDADNKKMHKLEIGLDAKFIFSAGGLVEHNKIVYITVYGNIPNSCFLYKSVDFAKTWEIVSKIQDGYNENSVAFIDDVMFCIMRNVDGVGKARIVKSNDFGETWIYVRDLDTRFHGMYALGLGDTIMISGRAYNLKTNIVFMNKHGDFMFNPISFGTDGDSSYSDICTFENYVYVIYYAQLTWQDWGIFVRRIERNKVLGLSY